MLTNGIFHTPPEHRVVLRRARMLIERSRMLLEETSAAASFGVKHHALVSCAGHAQYLQAEFGPTIPTAKTPAIAGGPATEWIGLASQMLRRYGRDIETDGRIVRCLVISELVVVAYIVRPDVALYRILQRDDDENISPVLVALWHLASGTHELKLYRRGRWETTVRKFAAGMLDAVGLRHLH